MHNQVDKPNKKMNKLNTEVHPEVVTVQHGKVPGKHLILVSPQEKFHIKTNNRTKLATDFRKVSIGSGSSLQSLSVETVFFFVNLLV
jgi:hypothetical protein